METESATVRTEPRGAAPSGKVSSTATCCPEVATFDGARSPDRVRGFDARTNLVNNRGSEEYWLPPTKAKTAPSDPYTQDGAVWASVGLDETTELEIAFEGHSGNGCLLNCTFEPSPAGIVELLDQKVAANNAAFRLRGLAEGETTIKVICNGAELGWVHVVCYKLIHVRAVVGWLNTGITRRVSYSASQLQNAMNRAFQQALIRFSVNDIGEINLIEATDLADQVGFYSVNLKEYGQTRYVDGFGEVDGDVVLPSGVDMDGYEHILAADLGAFVDAHPSVPRDQMRLIYFVHSTHLPAANGSVPEIGFDPCFAYKDYSDTTVSGWGIEDSYQVFAHEAGHACGLYHPNDERCAELPGHLRNSCGQPVSAEPATNTEPAIIPDGKDVTVERNRVVIMARDPLNLMGYWPKFTEAYALRKGQWDLCRQGVMKYADKE